ncbi:hypothetical protein E3N88_20867 [Mikania micrantha]|uniref:Uncharacterized protein n=1 Tax=Mikania micrantha TaxID=192012 RepID=A0A5N6NIQ5_9ASTR|nr:hypothetical protein E3N88_20867 [Mikania micrantha]
MSSRKRKSERIAKNSLGRFTNTEDNPIDLDSSEKAKGVVKRNSRDNPIKLDSTEKGKGIMKKNISKKGKSTLFDSDSDDEQPLSSLRRKVDGSRKLDVIRFKKPAVEDMVRPEKQKPMTKREKGIVRTAPENIKKSKGKEKLTGSDHEDLKKAKGSDHEDLKRAKGKEKLTGSDLEDPKRTKANAHGTGREKEPRKLNVPKKVMSSPAQLFRCVKLLRDKQKEDVRQMGFGSLLKFNIDGIPSRMVHFVVDRLKSKKMEIIGRSGSLKITPQMIHRLLGVPIGGIKIESIVPLEVLDESVCQWRRQYEGRLIAIREIVEKIESAEDENTFDFRMDFLLLFMTILVECHKNGRVRENILRYITSETDFSKMIGVITYLKASKVAKWDEFWNKNRLKIREDWEIKHGGFGRGSLKEELLEQGSAGDNGQPNVGTIEV